MEPYVGKCNNPHGEGYTAILEFKQEILNEAGMVKDFGELKGTIKDWIDNNLDHSYLCKYDDNVGLYLENNGYKVFKMEGNPTAENISKLIYKAIKKVFPILKKVGIIESFEDSVAYYEEEEK